MVQQAVGAVGGRQQRLDKGDAGLVPARRLPDVLPPAVRVGDIEDEEFLKSRSPLFKADKIKIPLLIAQGANDPRVKQAESEQIVEAVRKAGKPVEYLLFPDEGHGFARPENRLKFCAHAEAFLARHLGGGRVEPSTPEHEKK